MARNYYQCPRPVVPESWRGDSRRFANELIDLISTIYSWRGQLEMRDLTDRCVDDIARESSRKVSIRSDQITDIVQCIEKVLSDIFDHSHISVNHISGIEDKVSDIIKKTRSFDTGDITAERAMIDDLRVLSGNLYMPIRQIIAEVVEDIVRDNILRLLFHLHEVGVLSDEAYMSVSNRFKEEATE